MSLNTTDSAGCPKGSYPDSFSAALRYSASASGSVGQSKPSSRNEEISPNALCHPWTVPRKAPFSLIPHYMEVMEIHTCV